MKYFTKYWYELMQKCHYTSRFKIIEDKEYSDTDFAELYNQCLQEAVTRYQERSIRNNSENSFDFTEAIDKFNEIYSERLNNISAAYPAWLVNEVDNRLIALRMLPLSAFDRLKKEEDRSFKEFQHIYKIANEQLDMEKRQIPKDIWERFSFHDDTVMTLENWGDNLVMHISLDALHCDDKCQCVRVVFVDGIIIEKDKKLNLTNQQIESSNYSIDMRCKWLSEELYKTSKGYEAHMLLQQRSLNYLTILCSDIKFESGV